jgi:hypothetical protein
LRYSLRLRSHKSQTRRQSKHPFSPPTVILRLYLHGAERLHFSQRSSPAQQSSSLASKFSGALTRHELHFSRVTEARRVTRGHPRML